MSSVRPYIAKGFREDCSRLLSSFKEKDDIRFETFCETWQAMKFSLVFLCRESFADLLEFCEESLHIAKQYILPPYNFEERVGGLYLLYGLYYKMPVEKLVKIRITLSDFVQITELHREIRDGEHYDANYILSKMLFENAFAFCMFDKEMGLHKQHKSTRKHVLINNKLSVLPSINNMLTKNDGILKQINELSQKYLDNKKELAAEIGKDKVVKLFDPDLVNNLTVDYHRISEIRNSQVFLGSADRIKKARNKLGRIRSGLGRGFITDSSDDEEEMDEEGPENTNTEAKKSGSETEGELDLPCKAEPLKELPMELCMEDGDEMEDSNAFPEPYVEESVNKVEMGNDDSDA